MGYKPVLLAVIGVVLIPNSVAAKSTDLLGEANSLIKQIDNYEHKLPDSVLDSPISKEFAILSSYRQAFELIKGIVMLSALENSDKNLPLLKIKLNQNPSN